MPFLAPRRLCIAKEHDANGFPYQSSWKLSEDKACCQSKMNKKFSEYYDKAVYLDSNKGTWHISPLPKKFQKTEADKMRAQLYYYVNTNPGGDMSKITSLINKATLMALPKIASNVNFHGKVWETHLAKHHSAEDVAKWKAWITQYKESMTAQ
jgi:hypothetical protein